MKRIDHTATPTPTAYPLGFQARHCAGQNCWRHDHAGASTPLPKHPRITGWIKRGKP